MFQGGLGAASKCKRCDMTFCIEGKCCVSDMTDEEVRGLKKRGASGDGIFVTRAGLGRTLRSVRRRRWMLSYSVVCRP
jgi:hypothetical protein